MIRLVPEDVRMTALKSNPAASLKSIKNAVELDGFRQAHLRDGVAVTKFLCRLEKERLNMTETDVVNVLHDYRKQQALYVSESFGTIAAAGVHAAVVHYQPTKESNAALPENGVLLLDSGGQYLDGTTDVTRTVALGEPTQAMRDSFTHVLKAHLRLAGCVFPQGTSGAALDAVARDVLHAYGEDYGHGTGHGVGHFLNVHEGPFRISPLCREGAAASMVVSIEPGVYFENEYGIRIENLVYTVTAGENRLKFENLTLIPIDRKLINPYLLSAGEKQALNAYHRTVFEHLSPFMTAEECSWLKEACLPL